LNNLPSVFVIGDSISIHYGQFLEKALLGVACYRRKEGEREALRDIDNPALGANGGNSHMVRQYLEWRLINDPEKIDLLVVNCGLHDIRSDPDTGLLAVSAEDYSANLQAIIRLASELAKQMLWVRTTPVDDEMHAKRRCNFGRHQKDVDYYNQIADEVMLDHRIPRLSLESTCGPLGDGSSAFTDGVHFVDEARALQGGFLAGWIVRYFSESTA